MDDFDLPEWQPDWEWLPLYRLWAALPMEYAEYHEARRERDAEGLPEVWE